ncbi:MAG: hypothetical protein UY68_C0005G0030 [Parcubacteria group bacterium GW2011_GWF2_52_12]|nr:MAG: hypothetical protein UY68_C0005G0030 [Parcubacteria group bacterium GW2011_GWF2_52_12]
MVAQTLLTECEFARADEWSNDVNSRVMDFPFGNVGINAQKTHRNRHRSGDENPVTLDQNDLRPDETPLCA